MIFLESLEKSHPLSVVARFGASIAYDTTHTYIVGGIVNDRLVEEGQEIIVVSRDTLQTHACAVKAASISRPLLVGITSVVVSDKLVIMGGSAVCFSFGTFWNKGCYTLLTKNLKYSLDKDGSAISGRDDQGVWKYQHTMNGSSPVPHQREHNIVSTAPTKAMVMVQTSRIRLQSGTEFAQLLNNALPTIIEGADLGACTSTWTKDYLKDRIGERAVSHNRD
jgi:tRNA wybutosine-synthesizing protein 4